MMASTPSIALAITMMPDFDLTSRLSEQQVPLRLSTVRRLAVDCERLELLVFYQQAIKRGVLLQQTSWTLLPINISQDSTG